MSNGSLTVALAQMWEIFCGDSCSKPCAESKRKMAQLMMEVAYDNDCDIHNMKEIEECWEGV